MPWKILVALAYAGLYVLTPLKLDPHSPWTWALLFFADDFAYYWFHRLHHEVRIFWAGHVVHHSSVFFNLSTALRQTWTPMTGTRRSGCSCRCSASAPWMVFLQQSISLALPVLHPHRADRPPAAPVEWVFNTPSHHRVHHGANPHTWTATTAASSSSGTASSARSSPNGTASSTA